jgi:uncharacterized protein (DUF427 family)
VKIPGLDHPISVQRTAERVVVRSAGSVVADSTSALVLREGKYPPRYYVPLSDVDATVLRPSATHTYCPFKGNASYYDIVTADGELTDAVWTYEQPYPAVAEIAGHVAFYPDKVEIAVS